MNKALAATGYISLAFSILFLLRWWDLRRHTCVDGKRLRILLGTLAAWLVAIACLGASVTAQRVVVENVSTHPQTAWTFVGLPASMVPPGECWAVPVNPVADVVNAAGMRCVPVPGGVWMLAAVPANTRTTVEIVPPEDPTAADVWWPSFEWPSGLASVNDVLPRPWHKLNGVTEWAESPQFWPAGGARPPGAFLRLVSSSSAHQLWHLRTRIYDRALTFDIWLRVHSAQSTIEWTTHIVYGDVRTGQPISVPLGEIGQNVNKQPTIDYFPRMNIPSPVQGGGGAWSMLLTRPATWNRASRVEVKGAILLAPDPGRAQGRPLGAVCTQWDGHWTATGSTPQSYPGAAALSAGRKAEYLNPPTGHQYDQRAQAQPKVSGTTGEQPDFGCAAGEEVVTMHNPWAIHWLRYHAQAYCLRPTSNREVNGDPVRASAHPKTRTTNLRPDHRFSAGDMLGWPNPVPYSWPGTGYSTPDDQHRSDGLLVAMIALTRDPALEAIVEDYIELQKMGLPRTGDRAGTPRAIGRVLLANANHVWLGFDDAIPLVNATIDWVWERATFQDLPPTVPVRILAGYEEAKYGWKNAANQPIIGWQPWQETIAAIGFYGAYRATGSEHAREIARIVSQTVVEQAYYGDGLVWHTYAQRWRSEDPGSAHPPASWFPSQPNYDINTDGACRRWSDAASRILLKLDPNSPASNKAAALAAKIPANWYDSRWWAVR